MEIINGKELAKKIREQLKDEVIKLKERNINPKLAVIMVGHDKASEVYVRNKSKVCQEIGIEFEEFLMEETITQKELLDLINNLNERKDVHGILLQSPIPAHLDIREAFRGRLFYILHSIWSCKNVRRIQHSYRRKKGCNYR